MNKYFSLTICLIVPFCTAIAVEDVALKGGVPSSVQLPPLSSRAIFDVGEAVKQRTIDATTQRPRGKALQIYPKAAPAIPFLVNDLGSGTGFFIAADGWLITNHHVIKHAKYDEDRKAHVMTAMTGTLQADGWMGQPVDAGDAVIWAYDARRDLALLKLEPKKGQTFPFLRIAARVPPPGDDCVAIGHPGIGKLWSVRSGDITGAGDAQNDTVVFAELRSLSGRERLAAEETIRNLGPKHLQTDLDIHRGDSGGPLLNAGGEVIGVTVAFKEDLGTNVSLHVHLDELKAFDISRPGKPVPLIPSPFEIDGLTMEEEDVDGDKVPDAVSGRSNGELRFVAVRLTARPKTLNKISGRDEQWMPHFTMYQFPRTTFCYDRDTDGEFDYILRDEDGDSSIDAAYERDGEVWSVSSFHGEPISEGHFESKEVQAIFLKWVKVLGGLRTAWH